MKKLIVLMLIVFFIPAVCAAEIDLSGMSYDELVALKEQINLAMFDCDEWESVVVPQGLWEFGKDIPVDHWTITAEDGDYTYFCYGDTLDETGLSLDVLGNAYHSDEVASSTYETEYRTNIKERIDIDAKDGYYIEIIYGNCVFSPYNGKQDLGFKNIVEEKDAPSEVDCTSSTPKDIFASKPGIDGSNAYDIIVGLEEKGMPRPDTETIEDGFRWTSRSIRFGDTVLNYDIETNKQYEITHAYFSMNGENNGFIEWIGTLPHDSSNSSIVEFINSCIEEKTNDHLTVGDGIWGVIVGPGGVFLELQDVDAEAYSEALFEKLMNQYQ